MGKRYRTFATIEFAFVASLVSSFATLGIVGLLFGFQISQWTEWEGVIAGMAVTAAGLLGAVFGVYTALRPNQ